MVDLLGMAVLDNPVWQSLAGPHAGFAETAAANAKAARYPREVAVFAGLADPADERSWQELGALSRGTTALFGVGEVPSSFEVALAVETVQMVGFGAVAECDPEAVSLTASDVPEMTDLVERTRPGPFGRRTFELGNYYGIFREGKLISMAGERLHPPGFTEVSAVCTDAAFRGQGLAARLVKTVVAGVRARGEEPFLHAAADNLGAIGLYERLGFELRRNAVISVVRPAAAEPSS